MKQKLLDLNHQPELIVHGIHTTDYDVNFNFGSSSLNYTLRPGRTKKISTYLINKELADAVNAAIVTGRPLLIKGEPGSGKTKLAQAVASYFYNKDAYKYYFEWHVKSKSKAIDGGYVFDHVGRLRDATISQKSPEAEKRAADPSNYVTLGPMGMSFKTVAEDGKKPILLIDEIDKGDIDFPNDLLLELDEMRFKINELPGVYIEAPKKTSPLVFITSNNERDLPPAFLRRCLYYYIPPFGKDLLVKIAKSKINEFYDELEIDSKVELSEKSSSEFVDGFLRAKEGASGKSPSTSEMLDWLKLLTFRAHHDNIAFDELITNSELRNLALKLNA